jgi:type VI secretion system ImpC/EvpB family protein
MPTPSSRTGIEMSFGFAKPNRQVPMDIEVPLRILVLGDFSGRMGRTSDATVSVRPRLVDLADVESTLTALAPRLELELAEGHRLSIRLERLDDFHPNHLFETLDVFAPLRALSRDLHDRNTAADTLARIRARAGAMNRSAAPAASVSAEANPDAMESDRDAVARLLGRPPTQPASRQTSAASFVDALIQPLVAPQVAVPPDPGLEEVQRILDEASSALMRSVLHHPQFRALEASWRGLAWLCNQLGEAPNIEIVVLDWSKAELAAHWASCSDLADSPLHALLTEADGPGSGEAPWGLIVGNYAFAMTMDDSQLLGQMARIGEQAGAPFLSGAAWTAFTTQAETAIDEGSRPWDALRCRAEASHVGLAAPGFLLRLPYGKKSDPIDCFEFEELLVPSDLSHCLWGNAAWACAGLVGRSFMQSGWNLSPGDELEISGLPVHVYRDAGESVQAPCAETWVSSANAEHWSGKGLMVLQAVRGRDAVRLLRFQSLHHPPTMLSGPWR